MKRTLTFVALCLAGSAAAGWTFLAAGSTRTEPAPQAVSTSMMADANHEADTGADFPLCILNFSKDDCNGTIEPGAYKSVSCPDTGCRTIMVTGAVYETRLESSGLGCGAVCENRCDEFPDGRFVLIMDYVLRADSCCPYRGSWQGEWTYTVLGRVFTGRAHGTIGVGTNRVSSCSVAHDNCESCHDVQLSNSAWYIGFEGSFQGTATSSVLPYTEDLNFTMDGTWIIDANSNRPFREQFRVINRFDGAHLRWSCQ